MLPPERRRRVLAASALLMVIALLLVHACSVWPQEAWLLLQHGPRALRRGAASAQPLPAQHERNVTQRYAYITLADRRVALSAACLRRHTPLTCLC